jgi:hypothetical protein
MKLSRFGGPIACALLAWAGSAGADAVTDWNEIAQPAITAGRPGPPGVLDSALIQIAVHDAVQAIDRRFEPYHVEVEGAKGKRSAAAAAAAHAVLVGLYPAQAASLDATYFTYLANNGLTGDPGLEVGEKVAAGILPLARKNPNPPPPAFNGGTLPGQWRPTESFIGNPPVPPSGAAMLAPWVADFDPFTLTSPTRFRAEPPPLMTSEQYRRDFDEVKKLGSFASADRTPEQTDLAYFYSENFLAQWNRALRAIANSHVHRIGDSARLFALANMSMADAFITAWDSKRFYFFWRPITAIRLADIDGNPDTAPDVNWQSLINNPNYPDYTSGANNLTGAVTRTLALFFHRDKFKWDVTSNAPLAVQKTRTYTRFSDAAQDVVDARVYLGIHFRFADTAARAQGRRVADWAFNHFLLPLHGDDHHGHDD